MREMGRSNRNHATSKNWRMPELKRQFLEKVVTGRGSTILGRQLKLAEPTTILSLGETSFEYESDSGPENIVPDIGRLAWSHSAAGGVRKARL